MKVALVFLSFLFLLGCGSSNPKKTQFGIGPGESVWEQSRAHPSSYGPGLFNVDKEQTIGHRNTEQFYYKHCEEDGHGTWFSKTSYSCNER